MFFIELLWTNYPKLFGKSNCNAINGIIACGSNCHIKITEACDALDSQGTAIIATVESQSTNNVVVRGVNQIIANVYVKLFVISAVSS